MTTSFRTLSAKLILLVLLITTIPIVCIGAWSYYSGTKTLEAQFAKSFEWVANAKAQAIRNYLQRKLGRADDFTTYTNMMNFLSDYREGKMAKVELSQKLTELLNNKIKLLSSNLRSGVLEVLVVDPKGEVLGSTRPELMKTHQFSADFLAQAIRKNTIGDVYKHPTTNEIGFLAASPIQATSENDLGTAIVVIRLDVAELDDIVSKGNEDVGETGEYYLVNKNGIRITSSRFEKGLILEQEINTEPVHQFREKRDNYTGSYVNYRNVPVIGSSEAKIIAEADDIGWLLIVEMNASEARSSTTVLSQQIALFGAGLIFVSVLIGILFGRSISAPIKEAVEKFFTTSNELSATADQHQRTAAQQAAAVSETSTTMDELGRSTQRSIIQAESANATAKQTVMNAKKGAEAMQEMLSSMEELSRRVGNIGTQILNLSEQTSQIGHVTEAVKDIANQTNLLALNAAVEATRAGEHGKGFTVVSQEIRKLAEQSKKSAEQISNLVDTIQKGTNATVLATEAGTQTTKASEAQVRHTKENFDALMRDVNNVAEVLQQISLTAQQQSNATNQVVEAMTSINNGAQETANGINQSKNAIQNLNKAAEQLQSMV